MKTMIFLKMVKLKKGVETNKLSNDTKKCLSNFRETIPLITQFTVGGGWGAVQYYLGSTKEFLRKIMKILNH
jgi:hypothetical protein